MANLIVLTFDDTEQAGLAFEALKQARSGGHLRIDDSAVVVKDATGKAEIKNQVSTGAKLSTLGGGLIGALLAGPFLPLIGAAVGAAGGALVWKSLDMSVDQAFVKDVAAALTPGSSALFVLGSSDAPDVVLGALRPFQGKVYQTTLPQDAVDALANALKEREG